MSDFENFYVKYADERFTRDEMKAIYDGMNKSDYNQYSEIYPRYKDLDSIKKEILKLKAERGDWATVFCVEMGLEKEMYPLITEYIYYFTWSSKEEQDLERNLEEIKTNLTKTELRLIYENTMDDRQFREYIKRVEGGGKCLQSINKVVDHLTIPNVHLEFKFTWVKDYKEYCDLGKKLCNTIYLRC